MTKSFGYDTGASQFRIARHEVGDFGLHLSLIRSFVWGDNRLPESPFFSGKPLVYHYWVDWLSGQLIRLGMRVDYALNSVSAVALTILLYGLYRLTMLLFDGSRVAGLLSVVFFLLPSNLSFIDIFKHAPKDFSLFSYLWRFPDYIHQGPFDGSIITIYTTLSPYLNQRHLIAGMAVGVTTIWAVVGWLKREKPIPNTAWIIVGLILGAATRVHAVLAGATGIVLIVLLLGKRTRALLFFIGAAILTAAPHLVDTISMRSSTGVSQTWNPGYLAPRPLSMASWLSFWVYNLGILVFLIPPAYRLTNDLGRRLMVGAGALFVIANTVQISYRIEHSHSLINYATVITLPFIAYFLVILWHKRGVGWKLLTASTLFLVTASGVINLMVVKNDYQLMVDDAPKNRFIQWIQTQTDPSSIFIAQPALYDAVTLAGRKNYLGHEYYVSIMGYDYWGRRKQIDAWSNNLDEHVVTDMKKQHISYLAIPKAGKDFPYAIDGKKAEALLRVVYQDDFMTVYAL